MYTYKKWKKWDEILLIATSILNVIDNLKNGDLNQLSWRKYNFWPTVINVAKIIGLFSICTNSPGVHQANEDGHVLEYNKEIDYE